MMDMETRCHLSWSGNFNEFNVARTYGVGTGDGGVREGGRSGR